MNVSKEDLLMVAKHALHYTNLLVSQCDSWLPEGEECDIPNGDEEWHSKENKKSLIRKVSQRIQKSLNP